VHREQSDLSFLPIIETSDTLRGSMRIRSPFTLRETFVFEVQSV
jgi:hypothetical protein